jgi:hypothetical protein
VLRVIHLGALYRSFGAISKRENIIGFLRFAIDSAFAALHPASHAVRSSTLLTGIL